MILRKPYALFIKYFRLMHFVIAVLIGYLMYKTGFLYAFFNEQITSTSMGTTFDLTDELFNFYMFLIPLLVIINNVIILSVLIFKKKPYKFYVFSTLIYIAVIIMNGYFYDILSTLETGFVEVRTLRLVRDFIMFVLAFEFLTFVKTLISATGFDIKKFDFRKDLEDLNIEESDREEFEFEVKVDTDAAKRTLRSTLRHARYTYLENKFLFNLIGLIGITVISFSMYFNLSIYNKTLTENSAFTVGSMSMMITNTYVTNKDYKGNDISEDFSLVVVEISVKNNYEFLNKLEIARAQLDIAGIKFIHKDIYRDRLFDLGVSYDDSNLTVNFKKYLLVYEVPKNLLKKNMLFMYYDNINYVSGEMGASIIKVKVNPQYLDEQEDSVSSEMKKDLELNHPFAKSSINISEYAVEKSFNIEYNYCLSKAECYISKEYLTPGYNGNNKLVLMRIKGTLTWPVEIEHIKYDNLFKLFRDFGTLEYTTDGKNKLFKIQNEVVSKKSKLGYTFIEVPDDVFSATNVKIVLNIRNSKYIYTVK